MLSIIQESWQVQFFFSFNKLSYFRQNSRVGSPSDVVQEQNPSIWCSIGKKRWAVYGPWVIIKTKAKFDMIFQQVQVEYFSDLNGEL